MYSSDDVKITYGSSIEATGTLLQSTHPAQPVELLVSELQLLGECNTEVGHVITVTIPGVHNTWEQYSIGTDCIIYSCNCPYIYL